MTGSHETSVVFADTHSGFEAVATVGELAEGTVLQRVRPSGDAIRLVRVR